MDIRYRSDIDGLRGLAVLAVMLFHVHAKYLPGGYQGVDVFFVISGFLIASLIRRQREHGTFNLFHFYSRRVLRIFPALIVVLVAVLAAGSIYLLPDEFARLSRHALGGTLFFSNFQFWREAGYFVPSTDLLPLKHLWSLAVEEQFYLLFPIVLLLFTSNSRWILPVFSVLTALSYIAFSRTVVNLDPAGFYLPHYRVWELGAGICLAYAPKIKWPRGLGIFVSALGLGFVGYSMTQPVPSLLPVLGTVLMLAAGDENWLSKNVLSWPRQVGLISYPLYLWHWPLMSFYRINHFGELPNEAGAAIFILSFVLAWATYQFVERPIRLGQFKIQKPVALGVCMILLAVISAQLWNLQGVPGRYPAAIQGLVQYAVDIKANTRVGQCWLSVEDKSPFHPDCVDQSRDGKLVVLWGDSHAAMLYPGLLETLDKSKMRLGQFNRDSCPPLFGAGVEETLSEVCLTSNKEVLARLTLAKPALVFLFANWSMYPMTVPGLSETIERLEKIGSKVVVLGPAPQWIGRLPRVLTNYYFENGEREIPTRSHYGVLPGILTYDSGLESVFQNSGVRYVSLVKILCNENGCLNRFDSSFNNLQSWDYGHFTSATSKYVANQLVSQMD